MCTASLQTILDAHDWTRWESLAVVLVAIVGPFGIAFKAFQASQRKYYNYKARLAKTLATHTHTTNSGAHSVLLGVCCALCGCYGRARGSRAPAGPGH
jgi:hypothetical protein